jgi:hypothetical protein
MSFSTFPFKAQLGSDEQSAGLAWRMGIRSGRNAGKLIEDFGVVADKIVRPYITDLLPNSTTYSQYERIATELNRVGGETGKNGLYFRINRVDLVSTFELGEKVEFDLEIQGMKKVAVFDERNTLVGELEVSDGELAQKQRRLLSFHYVPSIPSVGKFNIKSYDRNLKEQLSTFRYVQLVPKTADYLVITENRTIVNYENAKYFGIFNYIQTKARDGWNVSNGTAVVGDGKQYAGNTNSTLSFFVNSSSNFKVSISASYQTEEGYDFLKVGYRIGNNTTQLLKSNEGEQDGISGTGSVNQVFDVPGAGPLEVFIQFIADGSVNLVGATVDKIEFFQ